MEKKYRYDYVENYVIKCRLYPNKAQAEAIDSIFQGIKTYYNCSLYEMLNNNVGTKEAVDKKDENKLAHWPNVNYFGSVEWKQKMFREHPFINEHVPSSAITCKSGFLADMQKSIGEKKSVERINQLIAKEKAIRKDNSLSKAEKKRMLAGVQVPHYYNDKKPRTSYSYQESYGKIEFTDNKNVCFVRLCKIDGRLKIRGWNQKVRFNEEATMDFSDFVRAQDKGKALTVTVSKDKCGDYYICFKLPFAYKPIEEIYGEAVGVDVGIRDLAVLSNGKRYPNKQFKKQEKKHLVALNRRLSRRQGSSNIKYREKEKENPELAESKSYQKTKLVKARLERKIERRRRDWNNCVSREIVEKNGAIAIEALRVKELTDNKYIMFDIGDAAMYDLLNRIQYKAKWHNKPVYETGQYEVTTRKCFDCGYIVPDKILSEKWRCPHCGIVHNTDVNAAKNILQSVLQKEQVS